MSDALEQVAKMLEEERTCHDDCMCNICIAKQQTWEAQEEFGKLTSKLQSLEAENKELKERKPCRKPHWQDCVSRETYEGHKKELQSELDKHRWIPVAERLPEKDGQVWICYKITGYTYHGYYDVRYKKWSIFDPCGGYSDIDFGSPPTHWKPIILPASESAEEL